MRLLFVSHLFPDTQEPSRGSANADLLHALADRWEIRVLALRPVFLWARRDWHPRAPDVDLRPVFQPVNCLPGIGRWWNPRFYARGLRKRLGTIRRDWHFDAVLTAWLHPDACAVALLRDEFQFRFVVVAPDSDAEPFLKSSASRKVLTSNLSRASGIVTSSPELTTVFAKAGFRKDRIHPATTMQMTVEACHRLLLPTPH
jgi:hypothetical protein